MAWCDNCCEASHSSILVVGILIMKTPLAGHVYGFVSVSSRAHTVVYVFVWERVKNMQWKKRKNAGSWLFIAPTAKKVKANFTHISNIST